MMTPAKQREVPAGFWPFCAHCFDSVLSRDGVAWCLLITLAGGMVYGGIRAVEIVGPAAARWLETSANTTASLGENVLLLTRMAAEQKSASAAIIEAVLLNSRKIDADTEVSRQFAEKGSLPARETATAMTLAAKAMSGVPEMRAEQLIETRRNGEALDRLNDIQEQVLEVLKGRAKINADGSVVIPNRRTEGGEETSTYKVDGSWRMGGAKN